MSSLLSFTVLGIFTGAAYAIAASGLVLTYSTTRVFNVAHGAFGMVLAFVYWDFSQRQHIPAWISLGLVLLVVAPVFGLFVQRFITRAWATRRSASRCRRPTCCWPARWPPTPW